MLFSLLGLLLWCWLFGTAVQKQQRQLRKDRAKDLQRQQQQQHYPQWANLHGQPHFFPQEEWATYFFPQLRHQQRMDIEALGRGGLV